MNQQGYCARNAKRRHDEMNCAHSKLEDQVDGITDEN